MTESEQAKPEQIKQDYHYQVDQQASVNAYFDTEVNGETVRFQITARYGANAAKIEKTVDEIVGAFVSLRAKYPRGVTAPTPFDGEPKYVPVGDDGHEEAILTATAGRLSYEIKDGKTFYHVMDCQYPAGAKPTKFGISVWSETLAAAKLNVSNPNDMPSIVGWRVDYILNDKGFPKKAVRLLPPK